jgi:hypothetical protein
LGHGDDLTCVKSCRGRAVEIRAQTDIIDADEIADMGDRTRDIFRLERADRALPEADPDHPAGPRHAPDLVIGQVAIDLAGRLDAAMARDHRPRRHRQHVGNRGVAGMRDVDDHALGFHPLHHLAAERRQPALGDAVHRARDLVVEEVRQAGHPKAGGIEHIEIVDVALEIVQPLDRQHTADHDHAALAIGEQAIDVGSGRDQAQPPAGRIGKAAQLLGMPQRALQQREPGPRRLQIDDRKVGDGVGVGRIGIVVLSLRRFGERREHLQRVTPLDQARQVDMAMIGARQQITLPRQAVGMHVGDVERRLQRLRRRRDIEGNGLHLVLGAVDLFRRERKEPDGHDDQDGREHRKAGQEPFFHRHDSSRRPMPARLIRKEASHLRPVQPQPLARTAAAL